MGRGGDTMLAHITPDEAEILRLLGGAGTTNPYTGLPEYKRFSLKRFIQQIAPVAAIAIAVFAPGIGTAVGNAVASAVGTTVSTTAASAIGSAVISGTMTAAAGGDAEAVLKSAAAAGVANFAGAAAGGETAGAPQAVQGAVQGAVQSGTQAALTGRDVGQAALGGAITGGAAGAYRDITAPSPVPTTTSAYEQYASNIDPALRETMSYADVLSGATASPYFERAQSNIDPAMRESMTSEQVATSPSLTTTLPGSTQYPELRRAGEQLVRAGAGEFARSLYDTPSAPSADSLASTGLFQPISVVPVEQTGVAPVARGKPILGGEDEEASGTWGSKTLRG